MPTTTLKKKHTINLIPIDNVNSSRSRTLNRISIIFLGVYMLALVILFSYSLFLGFQKRSLLQENSDLSAAVQSQRDKEGMLLTLANRLDISKAIFAKSSPSASELVSNVLNLVPPDVTLMNVEADKSGNTTMVLKSVSSLGVVHFMDALEGKKLSGVVLDALALNNEGEYVMSLTIKQ